MEFANIMQMAMKSNGYFSWCVYVCVSLCECVCVYAGMFVHWFLMMDDDSSMKCDSQIVFLTLELMTNAAK